MLARMSAESYAPPAVGRAPIVLTYAARGQLIAPYACAFCDRRTHVYLRPGVQPAACGRGIVRVILD